MKNNLKKAFYLLVVAITAMALAMPAFAGAPSVQENQNAGGWNGIWDFGQGPLQPPLASEDGFIPVGDSYYSNATDANGKRGVVIEANGGAPHRGAITFPLHIGILDTPQGRQPVYFVLSDTDEGNFAQEFGVALVANNLKMTKAGALEFQSGETFDVTDADTGAVTTGIVGSDFEFHPDQPEVTAAEALSGNLPANADTRWVFFTSPGTTNFLKNFPPGTPPAGQHMYVKSDISSIFASPADARAAGLTVPPVTHEFRVQVAMEVIKRTSTPNPNTAACYTDPVTGANLSLDDIPKAAELGLINTGTADAPCIAERVLINAFPAFPRGHEKEGMASPFAIPIADFSPLKRLRWNGKDVTVNVSYVQWGPNANQKLIVDKGGCDPLIRKNPPGPFSLYGGGPGERCVGKTWADRYKGGQTLEINITSQGAIAAAAGVPVPNVVKKAQQGSYMTDGDHPFYTPWEMSKCRASSVLGNVCAPKLAKMGDYSDKNHAIGRVIQSYNGKLVPSGGPGGFQHGLESYRGGIGRYTPMWHVTFLFYNCQNDPDGLIDGDANFLVPPTPDQGVLHSRMAKNFCNVSMQKKPNPGPGAPFIPDTEASGVGSPIKGPLGLLGAQPNIGLRNASDPSLDGTCVPPFFANWDARKFMGLQMQNLGAQCNPTWFAGITGTTDILLDDPESRLIRNIRAMDDLKALGLVLETDTPPGQRKGEFGTPAGTRLVVSCPAYIDVNL